MVIRVRRLLSKLQRKINLNLTQAIAEDFRYITASVQLLVLVHSAL